MSLEKLELMEKEMSVSWDRLDKLFLDLSGFVCNTRRVYGEDWAKAKYEIFVKFGNKLKLTREVENTVSLLDAGESLSLLLSNLEKKILPTSLLRLKMFLTSISVEEVMLNTISEDIVVLGEKVTKGSKFSRSLKRVISNKDDLNTIQIELSKYNEGLIARGKLEMSIDPIDILMMSVNSTRSWRSCHDIFTGEYAGGPISYLLDSSSFISQIVLPSGKPVDEEREPIPDKIWRRMGMFSSDLKAIMLSRSYPSANKNNTATLYSLIEENFGGTENVAYGLIDQQSAYELIEDCEGPEYNDILHSGVSLVPFISLDKNGHGITLENKKEDTIRKPLEEGLIDVLFEVGVSNVYSPTGSWIIYGSTDSGAFEEDYYDDDEDYDYDYYD